MGRVAMPERTGPKDLEKVLAKLKEEWRELADLLTSQSTSQDRVIEVEKILLRDTSGQYRGKISTNPDGSADLLLRDGSGKAWARLGVNQDGEAFLELKDKRGESLFKTGVGEPSPGVAGGPAATPVDAGGSVLPQPLASPDASPQPIVPGAASGEPPGQPDSGPAPPAPGQGLPPGGEVNAGAADRLEKLERQNRRQKMYWTIILAIVGLMLATQAYVLFHPIPSGLAREALELRDANGKVQASLGTQGGKVGLEFRDPEGRRRATLGLGPLGTPHLAFYDRDQRVRAELNLGPDGEPHFILRDQRSLQGKVEPNDFSDSSHRPQWGGIATGSEAGAAASPAAGPAAAVSPKPEAEAEIEVVGSKTSNKYHYPTCKWVKGIQPWNLIKFKSPGAAQARHYIPCPTCKPPPLSP
jgi:hypothetical protein